MSKDRDLFQWTSMKDESCTNLHSGVKTNDHVASMVADEDQKAFQTMMDHLKDDAFFGTMEKIVFVITKMEMILVVCMPTNLGSFQQLHDLW